MTKEPDHIEEAWSESRINKPKVIPMPLWVTDKEFDKIVESLLIRRKTDPLSNVLWERLSHLKDAASKINNN